MKTLLPFITFLVLNLNSFAQTKDSICVSFDKVDIQNSDTIWKIMYFQKTFEMLVYKLKLNSSQKDSLEQSLIMTCPSFKKLLYIKNNFTKAPSPLTETDYINWLYEDKNNGKLKPWDLTQINNLKNVCLTNLKNKNTTVDCDCVVGHVSEVINYDRFSQLSEYQKGKAISTIIIDKCK
jgi:hypothetical protein